MQLIGHRGARGEAPENTRGGFQYIHDLKLKAVEFDVRLTKDSVLAIMHDACFLRTSGIAGELALVHSQDLQHYDHRKDWQHWPTVEHTPLLQDILPMIEQFTHIEVEVKAVDDEQHALRLVEQLHQLLAGWQDRITITSFDLKVLQALQQLESDFKRGLLVELPLGEAIIPIAQQLGCCRIGLNDRLTTRELIEKIHAAQLQCSVWTVNEVERAQQLAEWQVDGLITDFPARMLAAGIDGLTF